MEIQQMISELDTKVKQQMKDQRLRNLQAQWYDLKLTKIAAEALDKQPEVEALTQRMTELEVAYNTILAVEVGE